MSDFKKNWVQGSYIYTKNSLTGEVSRSPVKYSSDSKFEYEINDRTFGQFKNQPESVRKIMLAQIQKYSHSLEKTTKIIRHLLGIEKYKN